MKMPHRFAILGLIFFSLLGAVAVHANDDAVFDQDIAKLAGAMKANDFATMVDMMYAPVVKAGGGRDSVIAQSQTLAGRIRFNSMITTKPYTLISGATNDYVVIPTHAEFAVDGKHYDSISFELAVRPHGASTWQYVDGAGITPKFKSMFFGDMPTKATLPSHSVKLVNAADSAPSQGK